MKKCLDFVEVYGDWLQAIGAIIVAVVGTIRLVKKCEEKRDISKKVEHLKQQVSQIKCDLDGIVDRLH